MGDSNQMIRMSKDMLDHMLDEAYYLGANEFRQDVMVGFDREFNGNAGVSKAAVISSLAITDPRQCLERKK